MLKGVTNIRHVGIVVTDLERSIHFYRNILGLIVKKWTDEGGKFLNTILSLKGVEVTTVKMYALGAPTRGTLIELLYFSSHPKKKTKRDIFFIGITHIAFTVVDLDSEYKRLVSLGVEFNSSPRVSPDKYAKVAFCKDPDGTLIELVEVLK